MRLFRGKDFTIGEASDEDISFCVDTFFKAMSGQPVSREALEQTLRSPNVIVLVAKTKNKIVGMISGVALPPPMAPRIDLLSVIDEESARRGLHGQLIDKLVDELKRRLPRTRHIDTTIPTLNPQFVATYSMKGFIVVGFIRGDQPGQDSVILRKNLSSQRPTGFAV
jgi:ribosomal protein S18 acetylase RimI-like enzyme